MTDKLQSLHARFCALTGVDEAVMRFVFFERTWYEFHAAGFTEEDMVCVIKHIQRLNGRHSGEYQRSLKLRIVIADLGRFAEDLVEARRIEQARKSRTPTTRDRALGELRGFIPERNSNPLQSIGEILKKNGVGQ